MNFRSKAIVVQFFSLHNYIHREQLVSKSKSSGPTEVSDDYSTEIDEDEGAEPTMSVPSGETNIKDVFGKVMINRTRPAPCTLEVDLYQLAPEKERRVMGGRNNGHCNP